MKSGAAANTGGATRALLAWILVLLVVANIVVWTAWPLRDQLVERGILAPPPAERVDLEPRGLPPIVERVEPAPVADQALDASANGRPGSEQIESAGPAAPAREGPSASPRALEVAGQPSVGGEPSAALMECVVVGPIGTREALEALVTRLRSTGALVDSIERPGAAPAEYVAYIEPATSRGGALEVLQQLEAQSIQDVAILLSGADENAVSVGVYRNRSRADARRDQIAALGYDVKVRERGGGAYRLRVREVSDDTLGDLAYEPCPDTEAG